MDNEDLLTLANFLENTPPSIMKGVNDLSLENDFPKGHLLNTPDLHIHCDKCEGIRVFRINSERIHLESLTPKFVHCKYTCSNCRETNKIFSLAVKLNGADYMSGEVYKLGELPPFGPQTPSKLITLVGGERDNFLKGRRCETQGLGIGAFIYYRRVVENQKNKILSEIIKVSKRLNLPKNKLETLDLALSETQFTKALYLAKDALPESLLINGQNPLTLLYRALSEGLHNFSDEECLSIAHDIRLVLGELSERLAQALKDDNELTQALSRLNKMNSQREQK
ncbi:hypothetical protein [Mannheimia indoligenes]|uniref:hypothetical protein n=1 Tax=Mannheimia indoligenes TaxID=3103145 RepID=UPI002FE64742